MKKLLFLILPACMPAHAPTETENLAADLASTSVALVRNDDEPYCSGTWISPSTILTANHCVFDTDHVDYVMYTDVYARGDYKPKNVIAARSAHVLVRDKDHDLALLNVVSPPQHAAATLSNAPIAPGATVCAMGQPLGLWFSFSSGEVAAIRYIPPTLYVQATTPISAGSSGGGLFDRNGRLVGVTDGHFKGQNLNLFVHVQYVRDMLK